ncbi:hypothetical protein [Glaciibacter flavus]|uniref:hypothetical protein n=1 Tax=Orlajensenia flava TaxID=2565934 RepID=UPI003AFF8A16
MDETLDAIRTEYRGMQLQEILHQPARALLGVTTDAEAALAKLEVTTVFDLATSAAFTAAALLVEAGTDLRSAFARYGAATADIVRDTVTAGVPVAELQFLGIDALDAVPKTQAPAISAALDVATVRDFALYPPYRTARAILSEVYFPDSTPDFDPERPADLLPGNGEYPTERVQYQTLLMDAIDRPDGEQLVGITSQVFTPIDLASLAAGDAGFQRVAFGALLTFNQSWYSQGVTLGQLLHSAALAPGESTRIAVIDWSRRSRAGETEAISETDDLTNDTSHNRGISEVTDAVATEAQEGFSHTNATSRSDQSGTSEAGELSAPLGGLFGGPSGSMGHTSSTATNTSTADSYSSSFGQREVASSMSQNIADRTHQNAHSSRSRRASVVKEVAQSEHEGVSTRVIANYNHMHALTIQYYEVVQVHRVDVTLAKAERIVFIPVKLIDFADERMIRRFRAVLSRAALTYAIREALDNLDVVEIKPDLAQPFTVLGSGIKDYLKFSAAKATGLVPAAAVLRAGQVYSTAAASTPVADAAAAVADAAAGAAAQIAANPAAPETGSAIPNARIRIGAMVPLVQTVNDSLWSAGQTARISSLIGRALLRPDSTSIFLPTEVTIEGARVDAGGAPVSASFTLRSGAVDQSVSTSDPLSITEVTRIGLRGSSPERDVTATLTLTINRNGVRFPVELPSVTIPKGRSAETSLVTVNPGGVDANLTRHLADNRLWYSQAVLRSLDAAQLALLLSGYSVTVGGDDVPVAQVIDPIPVRYVGNYLAFRMSIDARSDAEWAAWLKDHDVAVGKLYNQDIVPLGTGGTFAEAVLGRSNSAEKLDITRFWDWQDSPIPLQPTEIAAIQTGSRATEENVTPGQLSTPIINITTPTTLPDPAGTAAVLQAVQNGSMFRDMSGLQATIGLAQAGLQTTMAGASAAGQQAGTNMDNLLKANTERQRIAAEMITSLAKTAAAAYTGGAVSAGGGISGGSGGGSSQQGAKINYFDKTKTDGTTTDAGAGGGGATGGGTTSGGSSGGGGSTGGSGSGLSGGGSGGGAGGYSANPAALSSLWGDTQSPSGMIGSLLDKVGLGGGNPETPAPLTTRKAWPKLDPTLVVQRINDLAGNANLVDQGYFGLCTVAAFLHHQFQAKPNTMKQFGNALFGSGVGFIGGLKVAPGSDLRNADYTAIAAASAGRPGHIPPQADWMMMSAIRDSENWFFDFEGAPDEESSMSTSAKELAGFYKDTGFYRDVTFNDDANQAEFTSINKGPKNHVALWVDSSLVIPTMKIGDGSHMVTLESAISFDVGADTCSFDYWTWGETTFRHYNAKLSDMVKRYMGVIIATLP